MDAFKKTRPPMETCKCCMPKHLKAKPNRIARKRLRSELAFLDLLEFDDAEPLPPGALERMRLLVDGVHVDIDLPIDPDDE